MDTVTISVKHVASHHNQPCAVCAAMFIPAEDSGSRVMSMSLPYQEAFGALLCGGCYSKWSHGTTVTLRHRVSG
jgi:hypothetical protein